MTWRHDRRHPSHRRTVTARCWGSQGGRRPGRILAGRWVAWQWRPGRIPVGWKTVGARCPTRHGGRAGGRTRGRSRSPWKQWHSVVVTKQVLGESTRCRVQDKRQRKATTIYMAGVLAKNPRPHTRLPTRTDPQPSARPTLVPRTGHHSVLGDHVCQGQGQGQGRDKNRTERILLLFLAWLMSCRRQRTASIAALYLLPPICSLCSRLVDSAR